MLRVIELQPVKPEDKASAAEELVKEGMDEANRDRRIAAADPDFEPWPIKRFRQYNPGKSAALRKTK